MNTKNERMRPVGSNKCRDQIQVPKKFDLSSQGGARYLDIHNPIKHDASYNP